MIYPFVFFILTIISLFILYVLSENDFVLIRKNITLPMMFNNFFISMFAAFITGRLFFALDNYNFYFLNPLVLFNFIRFPGFSLFGAVIGMVSAVSLLVRDPKSLPRMLDIISLSLFPYLFLYFFQNPFATLPFILLILISTCLIFLFKVFNSSHKNYFFKDSSLFFVILITYAHLNLLYNLYDSSHKIILIRFSFSDILSILLILVSVFFLVKNERNFLLRK